MGHTALVHAARDAVGEHGRVEMWSFDPPPASVLHPGLHLDRLTTFDQRRTLLLDAGADEVKRIEPTTELLSQSPEEFIRKIVKEANPSHIVEGDGFRFGKNRTGSSTILKELGQQLGFTSIVVAPVEVALRDHLIVRASSSMVRWLLKAGRVEDAAIMLGRPVQVVGRVEQGKRQGRVMGIPTANLGGVETMLPSDGVYGGVATVDGNKSFQAAISIGTKPTFGKNKRVCEVHLIGYDGESDHYDWTLAVTFTHWIRDQLRFDSMDDLKRAMHNDIERIHTLLESSR